jgi:polysaccharide biosynthesis/export protein
MTITRVHPRPSLRRRLLLVCCAFACLALVAAPLHAQQRGEPEREERRSEMQDRLQQRSPRSEQLPPAVEIAVDDTMYVVGPGDELAVNIFGSQFYTFTVPVSSDGTIVLPGFGTVRVHNATLREVRDRVHALLRNDVRKADILVSLARARQVKVTVAGAVRMPGVIVLPATARVSEALEAAGGIIPDTTSLRNILVQRTDGAVFTADLLRYLRLGDLRANPFVSGGDRIVFRPRDNRIGAFGAVGAEGWFDFVEGETLYSALEVSQGLRASAFRDSVEIVRFGRDHVTTRRMFVDLGGYPVDRTADMPLQPGDLVLVRSIPRFQEHRLVVLRGEVRYQGTYSIDLGTTRLRDLIQRAGGFTDEASLEEAIVVRKTPENERDREFERLQKIPTADMREDEYEYFKARSRERIGQMVVDFKKLFLQGDPTQNIVLQEGDIIEVPRRKDYIRVIGRVNNPGNVIFATGWTFEQYITAAGGYGWRADDGDVRVVKARTGELVDADDEGDYELEPGDTIWVPEVPEVKFWEIALTTLGVISQVAGIVGIIIAISRIN